MIKITEQFFVDIHNISLQSSLLTIITDCIKLKEQILFFKFTESVTKFNSKKEEYNNFLKEALSLITKLRDKVTELIEKAERTFIDSPDKIDEEKIKIIDRKYQEIEDSVFLALKALNEIEEVYKKLSPNEITTELTTERNKCITRFNTMLHNLWARLNNIATGTTYYPKNFEGVNVDEAYFAIPHLETLLQKALSHYHGWAENSVKTR